jgi:hypothetical protein
MLSLCAHFRLPTHPQNPYSGQPHESFSASGSIIRDQDVEMVAAPSTRAAIFCTTVLLSAYSVAQQAAPQDADTIQLIEQLAAPQPEVREHAFASLQAKGIAAFDLLFAQRETECLEQRLAIYRLLQLIEFDWSGVELPEPVLQMLVDYRRQSVIRRKVILERIELADQPATVIALANLSHYERSEELSCQAAICLIRHCSIHSSQSALALEAIGNSPRKSCVWIRDALKSDNSREFAERWTLHLQDELSIVSDEAGRWQPELLFQLLEWTLPQLLARNEGTVAGLIAEQCVQHCPDNLIGNFTDLFIRIKAWPALDQLVDQFGNEFNHQPLLLYRLAAAKLQQGDSDAAMRLIKRTGQNVQPPDSQLETGIVLKQLGYPFVAEQVLKSASARSDCPLAARIRANLILAHWLSQQDRNAEAVHRMNTIRNQLELQELEPAVFQQVGYKPEQIASLACLYQALDFQSRNDLMGCEASILKGLQTDPNQTELLILGYRIQFSDHQTNDLVRELIRLRQQELLEEIAEQYAQATGSEEISRKTNENRRELALAANRYAWLTANTTGDPENALRYAQLANELVERNPYYLDTEARCCFVLGDVGRAIAIQSEACRLARHDCALQNQLRSFQRFQGMTPIAKIPGQLK